MTIKVEGDLGTLPTSGGLRSVHPAGCVLITDDLNPDRTGTASCVPAVPVIDVRSREPHGTEGEFDVFLPLTGSPGIECRTGGANGDHTIVFTFPNPVGGRGRLRHWHREREQPDDQPRQYQSIHCESHWR